MENNDHKPCGLIWLPAYFFGALALVILLLALL
jgi:hypothetical protein